MMMLGYPGSRYDKARERMRALLLESAHSAKARCDLVIANEAVDVVPMLREAIETLLPLAGIGAADAARGLVANVLHRLTEDLSREPGAIGHIEAEP